MSHGDGETLSKHQCMCFSKDDSPKNMEAQDRAGDVHVSVLSSLDRVCTVYVCVSKCEDHQRVLHSHMSYSDYSLFVT